MRYTISAPYIEPRSIVSRVLAQISLELSWREVNQIIKVPGNTEIIGKDSALISVTKLPPVGTEVRIKLDLGRGESRSATAQVIRTEHHVERPQAALTITGNQAQWAGKVWDTALAVSLRTEVDEEDPQAVKELLH